MLKRIAAAIIAAAMMISTVPVMAEQNVSLSSEKTVECELFDDSSNAAVLFSEPDEFSAKVTSEIEKQQVDGEKCTVVVDDLEKFNFDCEIVGGVAPEVAQYLLDVYLEWAYMYNIMSVKGECNRDYILEKLTFEIDNSVSVDTIVKTMSDKAAEKIENPDNYDKVVSDLFTQFPVAAVHNNSKEIVARLQISNPELCYIQSKTNIDAKATYSQFDDEFTIATLPKIGLPYLPISYSEYQSFEKKLDDIVAEVICPDMNDVQKAMALHDWIIDNAKYGYKLDASIYESEPTTEYHIIYNIDEYEKLMNMLGDETMIENRMYAHTAYGPAMYGYGVCQGYTVLYSALLNKVGIENGTYVSDLLKHQWSLINIDGQWYHTDVTWDDPTPLVGYETIKLQTSTGDNINLCYQTEDNHCYSNFLMSEERSIEEKHTADPAAISLPDVECNDDSFHAVDTIGGVDYAHYAFEKIYYTKLNYSDSDKMYYYAQDVLVNNVPDVWYYKLPLSLKNADGTFAAEEKVSKEEFEAAISGKAQYVTVQIPDETVINNSVDVECMVKGAEGDGLTMENIGTSIVAIKAEEDAGIAEVDAYLVYYGENNAVIDVVMKTAKIDGSGEVKFNRALPEGAVEAKIIILDADAELVPVIKALGVTAAVPEVPAA